MRWWYIIIIKEKTWTTLTPLKTLMLALPRPRPFRQVPLRRILSFSSRATLAR